MNIYNWEIKMNKKYENWYWEVDEFNDALVGRLHFTQFYDDEVILEWQQNNSEKDTFYYTSKLMKVEQDSIYVPSENPDEAMEQFVDMIEDHMQDQISFYEDMLEKFKEEKL